MRMPELRASRPSICAAAAAPSRSPQARRASTSGASSCVARIASPSVSLSPRSSSSTATCGRPSAMRRWARARSDDGCCSRPASSCSASESLPWQDAQLGQGGHRRRAHRRDVAVMRLQRGLQRLLGLRPAAAREEDVGVDRAAGADERHRAVLAREVVDELAPLRGALPVARAGGRHDQVAVGLGERVDVAHPARRGGGHRLLQQRHPVLQPAGADLGAPEQAEREDLEVARAGPARDVHRAACVLGALGRALGVARPFDRDPALALALVALGGALGARQPAAGGRGAPGEEVLMRHPDGDARALVAAAIARIGLEGALAGGDAVLDAAEEPERQPEAVEGVGALLLGSSAASNASRAASQCAASSSRQPSRHCLPPCTAGMTAIIASTVDAVHAPCPRNALELVLAAVAHLEA